MYQVEHDELFAGIRTGKPLNNGEYMAKSTMLAIMGRMATYTGQEITWEQAMNSVAGFVAGKVSVGCGTRNRNRATRNHQIRLRDNTTSGS